MDFKCNQKTVLSEHYNRSAGNDASEIPPEPGKQILCKEFPDNLGLRHSFGCAQAFFNYNIFSCALPQNRRRFARCSYALSKE